MLSHDPLGVYPTPFSALWIKERSFAPFCAWRGHPCRALRWKKNNFFGGANLGGEKLLEQCRWNMFKAVWNRGVKICSVAFRIVFRIIFRVFQTVSQRALRGILMPCGKNWLPTVSRQFLTRNYPRSNCLLICLPNCLSPTKEDIFSSFKIAPAVRITARQLRDKNCLAANFVSVWKSFGGSFVLQTCGHKRKPRG